MSCPGISLYMQGPGLYYMPVDAKLLFERRKTRLFSSNTKEC